jgi:hypothetical protein
MSRNAFMAKLPNQPATGATVPPVVYVTEKTIWEYKQVTRNLSTDTLPTEEELNRLGKDGWELVGILNNSGFAYLYFKRVKY